MIPISKDQLLTWTDPEDGSVFEFAAATGENGLRLQLALTQFAFDPTPHITEAQKRVLAESPELEGEERNEKVRRIALVMARDAASADEIRHVSEEENKAIYDVVNVATISCAPKGKEKIRFNGDATNHFQFVDCIRLFSAYIECNNLSREERKN